MAIPMARFLGLWNCSQSRSRTKRRIASRKSFTLVVASGMVASSSATSSADSANAPLAAVLFYALRLEGQAYRRQANGCQSPFGVREHGSRFVFIAATDFHHQTQLDAATPDVSSVCIGEKKAGAVLPHSKGPPFAGLALLLGYGEGKKHRWHSNPRRPTKRTARRSFAVTAGRRTSTICSTRSSAASC